MADTERLMNKAQGDDIISALATIAANILQVPSEKLIIDWSYTTLPASGNDHTIYAIPTGDADDPWDFYVWNATDEEWVQFDWNFAVDSELSTISENPVQNKVVTAALDNKVDKVEGKGLSTNDYTNEDKALVATIPDKADTDDVAGTLTATGNPITLTDCAPINAESLVVELEPQQDLHGQSYPYVGGAGKNKLEVKAISRTFNGITYTVYDDGTIKVNGTASGLSYLVLTNNNNDLADISNTIYAQGMSLIGSTDVNGIDLQCRYTDGDYGTFTNGQTKTLGKNVALIHIQVDSGVTISNQIVKPMIRLSTETDPTFAPYSNICPITGYTECEVDDVAENLYDKSSVNTGKYMNLDGSVSDWGTVCYSDYIRVKPNTSYYFSHVIGSSYGLSAICFDGLKNPLNHSIGVTGEGDGNGAVTTPNDCAYIVINAMASNKDIVQITEGSTAPTTYQPYQSTSASISFGQTVYGGRSNFTDGGTESNRIYTKGGWTQYNASNGYKAYLKNNMPERNVSEGYTADLMSNCINMFGSFSSDNMDRNIIQQPYGGSNRAYMALREDLNPDDVEFSYITTAPSTLSTPPTDLKLLQGTNHITTNGTTINLGYQPDNVIGEVKGEIEKHLEMPYLRILDNDVDTEIKNYRLYYKFISSAYTLVNLEEMLRHRFIFVEVINNPSGTANHELLHSALIDPRTIDGFEYGIDAGSGDTICIESIIAENKFALSVRYTGSHTSGDPTDYYVTIRMVD